jgi:hypothetical protein
MSKKQRGTAKMKKLLTIALSALLLTAALAACKPAPPPPPGVVYNDDGSRTEYEYDINGNPVKTSFYDADGTLLGWEERKFDEGGWVIEKPVRYDADGKVIEDD